MPDLAKDWSLGCRASGSWKAENSHEILSTGMTNYRLSTDLRFFLSVYFVELVDFGGLIRRYFMNAPHSTGRFAKL